MEHTKTIITFNEEQNPELTDKELKSFKSAKDFFSKNDFDKITNKQFSVEIGTANKTKPVLIEA